MQKFRGFDKKFFDFFKELTVNNNREWFLENKNRYEDCVVSPILAFITEMQPRLEKISPHFLAVPKKSGGSMFRIYKDVRFSKDKKPYKENAGCQFRHENGKDAHAPGYYVHLEPGNIFFGGGIWMPAGEALKNIRAEIAEKPLSWSKVIGNKKFCRVFGGVEGESLKRPPRDFSADLKYIDDIKRKSFFAMHKGSMKVASSEAFLDEVTEVFTAATPLMKFLCKSLDQKF